MIPALIVFAYLALVLYVGIFAFRRTAKGSAEDFFVANRSLGTFVFLLSLFGTNMTSFSILGASGLAYRIGIGVFGLMASVSAIVLPVMLYLVGTRIWAIGKKFGHMTQVQIFRDRWDDRGHVGTVIFALQAVMLVPYIIIGVMGGGETLEGISNKFVPYWVGGGVVALVVMSYVFFGGMRGTAWVNTLQTLMFLTFGAIAFVIIARGMGGFTQTVNEMAQTINAGATPATQPAAQLTRHRISQGQYLSYALIPLSSIMFPHIAIFCLTARRMTSFRKTVIFYPICILLIWLPSVFLGAVARFQPQIVTKVAAANPDGVMLILLHHYAPVILAGILGAAIMACVMASDSQILALSTMWAEDVYRYYGGTSEAKQVWSARIFVVACTVAAYFIALAVRRSASIFDLSVQYAFAGYASLSPVMIACLFWKRSTKWGALAATIWIAGTLLGTSLLQYFTQDVAPRTPAGPAVPLWSVGDFPILLRDYNKIVFTKWSCLIVLPMFLGSTLLVWVVSLVTPPPSRETIARYFPSSARPESAA